MMRSWVECDVVSITKDKNKFELTIEFEKNLLQIL